MAWRLLFSNLKSTETPTLTLIRHFSTSILKQNLNPHPSQPHQFLSAAPFATSFPSTKRPRTKLPKKYRRKRKKPPSARNTLVQTPRRLIPHFERIVERDAAFRFLFKSKAFLLRQREHILRLEGAGMYYRELGFPRGRKVARYIERHPLLYTTYRHDDRKTWFGFTEFMEGLIDEEKRIMDSMEADRVTTLRKLLMMSANKRIPLSKIFHCRALFGVRNDLRDWVLKFPNYFRVVEQEEDGKRILELVDWDPSLAVSAIERLFVVDEEQAKRAFRFPVKHVRALGLGKDVSRKVNMLNVLPLVSPYSDGSKLEVHSMEAEKYRLGVLHEFLSLTLEKRASIHHIVEFREELSLTKNIYHMLLKQPRTFYVAGTEMNWVVFLKDAYDENGKLIEKDPQVIFNEKLRMYARTQKKD